MIMTFFKDKNLTFKFSLMFAVITITTLLITFLLSFFNQNKLYKKQKEESIQHIADFLQSRIVADGEDFIYFQDYFIPNYEKFKIEMDFNQNTVDNDREIYEKMFAEAFPGKVLGRDVNFSDFSDELKHAYSVYNFEYYTLMFEEAVRAFNIAYTYYIIPTGEKDHFYWSIVSLREAKEIDGKEYLLINDDIDLPQEKFPLLWEAWNTGKRPSGYHVYNNEYGKTYAYYTPLYIYGKKLGVIGVEVEISKVNHDILNATFHQMLMIAVVLVTFMILLLILIRTKYIRKLEITRTIIDNYSNTKNTKLAEQLAAEVTNHDEISTIMGKFSDMIYELDLYMHNLTETKKHLQDTQQKAMEMSLLAIKDSLTGIRNKTGYDREVAKIQQEISEGLKDVGVAVVDLNFLKRINDNYGHDKGNVAIISLCKIVCHVFEHSPVFRIGGDEFAIILKNHDLEHVDDLINEFMTQIKERQTNRNYAYWEKNSAAIGYAVYNPAIDSSYEDLFKRADSEMYKVKKEMKGQREA